MTLGAQWRLFVTPYWLPLMILGLSLAPSTAFSQPGESPPMILISARDMIEQLNQKTPLSILDARSQEEYEAGHIPGAVRVDVASWKKATERDEQLCDPAFWAKELGALGIDGTQTIVVYGKPLTEAARVWWLLKFVGCNDVRLLDGGFDVYQSLRGPVSAESPTVKATVFQPHFQLDRWMTADELLIRGVQNGECQIVDNRTAEEYRGEDTRGARSGRIPGAHHSDWRQYLAEDGTFLPVDELRNIIAASGTDLERPLVTHCHSGGRSSVGAFVLELVTGRPARNYYRSWADWSSRDELPIAR